MKKFLFLLLFVCISSILIGGEIDKSTAEKIATNFFYERIQQYEPAAYSQIKASETFGLKLNGTTLLYAVNIGSEGFVLVSTFDNVRPVPGYSLSGRYTDIDLPGQFADLLEQYKLQINEAAELNVSASAEIKEMWKHLKTDNPAMLKPLKYEKAVESMLVLSRYTYTVSGEYLKKVRRAYAALWLYIPEPFGP